MNSSRKKSTGGPLRTVISILAAGVILCLGTFPVSAQVCVGDITLETQTDVDNFSCTEVTGSLIIIEDHEADPIKNLNGLSGLTSVGESLHIIGNEVLTDLDGLGSLTSIGESLNILQNDALANLDDLSALTSIGETLLIQFNGSLTDVDGLSGVKSVGLSLSIWGNEMLTDIDGLSGVTSVGGRLLIRFNDSLTDFCGLFPLLDAGGLLGTYNISDNEVNPTEQDILDGGPCDPDDTIADLLADGAINFGQAAALSEFADQSLIGLENVLTAFVDIGLLTRSEAQLLFVIASIQ